MVRLLQMGDDSRERMSMIKIVTDLFKENLGYFPSYIVRAPGRVNLLGEHVDYNDGFAAEIYICKASDGAKLL